MSKSAILFLIGILLIILTITAKAFSFNFREALNYFKRDKHGRNAWPGILMFMAIVIALVLGYEARGSEGKYFPSVVIRAAAIQSHNGNSVFCKQGGANDKATAYGSIELTAYERENFKTFIVMEHHQSCILNGDAHQQDAFGVGFSYTVPLNFF